MDCGRAGLGAGPSWFCRFAGCVVRAARFTRKTGMTKKDYEMLAKYASHHLNTEQKVALADWIGMHNKNFFRSRFLVAAGMTDQEILDQLQGRLL